MAATSRISELEDGEELKLLFSLHGQLESRVKHTHVFCLLLLPSGWDVKRRERTLGDLGADNNALSVGPLNCDRERVVFCGEAASTAVKGGLDPVSAQT